MKCKECGKKIKKKDKVCPGCGASLIPEDTERFGDTIRIDLDSTPLDQMEPIEPVTPEPIPEIVEEPIQESTPEPVVEPISEPIPEPIPELVPEAVTEAAPKPKPKPKKKKKKKAKKKPAPAPVQSGAHKAPAKKKNYDHVVKHKSTGEYVALKAVIIVMLVLIFTIAAGTIMFINSGIKHDASVRYNKLVEMGATTGVNKLEIDEDLGKYLYVSGTTESLPLFAEADGDSEVLMTMTNGNLVTLEEKTGRLLWLVTDYATKTQGYASPVYLTSDPDKVIEYHNDSLLGQIGNQGEKIEEIYYVLNAGVGIGVYASATLDDAEALDVLTDGNVVGLVAKTNDQVWRVYDYKSSQYGYMESKYLTDNPDALSLAGVDTATEEEEEPPAEEEEEEVPEKQGPEYYVSWSQSALSVRDGPTQETGNQVNRIVYGDVVEVIEQTNDTFWYVYIPHLDMYGYVKGVCLAPVEE